LKQFGGRGEVRSIPAYHNAAAPAALNHEEATMSPQEIEVIVAEFAKMPPPFDEFTVEPGTKFRRVLQQNDAGLWCAGFQFTNSQNQARWYGPLLAHGDSPAEAMLSAVQLADAFKRRPALAAS
jgi:hypothetical protein